MLLPCPYCGPRDEIEFTYGGEAMRARPCDPQASDEWQWAEYLYAHDNPRGQHQERWCHTYGCGRWLRLVRNTQSHRVDGASGMAEPS